MKIKAAHIDGFGKWHDQDFNFVDQFQVIYGPNEAGKTTLMAFIISILFGFTDGRGKNRFQQYYPKNTTTYGGSLLVEVAGQEYRIRRMKGKNGGKVTVINQAGQQFGPEKLHELVGTMDRSLYQALFSFSQRDLQLVTEIDRSTWQRHLQKMGAVGSNKWLQVIAKLKRQADHLYLPRGRKWPLNRDLKEYQKLQAKIDQAQSDYIKYQHLQEQAVMIQKQLRQLKATIKQHQVQSENFNQQVHFWPIFKRWQAGKSQVQQANMLSDKQVLLGQRLQVQITELTKQLEISRQELATVQKQLKRLGCQDSADVDDLDQLYQQTETLLSQGDLQAELRTQLEAKQQELSALQERYKTGNPNPLTSNDFEQLQQLLGQQENYRSERFKWWHKLIIALGIVIGIAGGSLGTLGLINHQYNRLAIGILIGGITSLLVTFVGVVAWYHRRHKALNEINSQINKIGQAYQLDGYPVQNWIGMQGDLHRYQLLQKQVQTWKAKVDNYQTKVAKLQSLLHTKVNGNDLLTQKLALKKLLDNQQQLLQQVAELKKKIGQGQTRLAPLRERMDVLYQLANVHSSDEFNKYLKHRAQVVTQQATVDAYDQQLPASIKKSLQHYSTEKQLADRLTAAKAQVVELVGQQQQLQQKLQDIEISCRSLADTEVLDDLIQQQANLKAEINDKVHEWLTYQLAMQWITETLMLASADRYPVIMKRAEEYFRILTDYRYDNIRLDDDGLHVMRNDQVEFLVEELSQGTAEQLDVAMRLGFVTVMSNRVNLPIMIDDGFVNFDQARRQHVLTLLKKIAQHQQVLYFTADQKVKDEFSMVVDLSTSSMNKM